MFIELDRRFHELSESSEGNLSGSHFFFSGGDSLSWDSLIQEYRVVVLSEAGSGKTEEIRHTTRRLRAEGKSAFFIRLEHIPHDFESAFEEGTYEEFEAWKASDGEAWILLDSVDEARLRDPSDFELAIRKLGRNVIAAKQRIHVIITGRTSAWRPKTDLALCEKHLTYVKPAVSTSGDNADTSKELIQQEKRLTNEKAATFKIVALNDLSSSQVEIFASTKGVTSTKGFLDAVERADAWLFTTRPQDLEELVEFWNDHGRIGTRLELMQNSIERRLRECDEDRAEARPLSMEKALQGAMQVAAASTLAHEPTIQVPDGSHNSKGLQIKLLLREWNDVECATLLGRPIFDEAIYGTVRFHHRSVREYLTAKWFASLLNRQTSRRSIEQLFFREQYGLEVVVPAMRPVLPWLAIFDERIRNRVCRLAPEVLFEGGDPSQLPLDTRQQILRDVCEQLASGISTRSMADLAAVQRFANVDLATDIKELLNKFHNHDDLLWFLLRMVWHGEVIDALPEAKRVALGTSLGSYSRVAAFRVVLTLGSSQEKTELRLAFQDESDKLSRDLLATLLENTTPSREIIPWLFNCLHKLDGKKRFHSDQLTDELCNFVEHSDPALLPSIIEQGNALLEEAPVVERRHCEISTQNSWLIKPVALAVERLVKNHDPAALSPSCLSALQKIPILKQYDPTELTDTELEFRSLVPQWPELNLALFWYLVENERARVTHEKGKRLTDWWSVGLWRSYVDFSAEDFGTVLSEVKDRPLLDDKLIALSLAFHLYADAGRSPKARNQLRVVVQSEVELTERLNELMHPPRFSAEVKKIKRVEAGWEKKAQRRREKAQRNRNDWKKYLTENIEKLRDPGLKEPNDVSQAQHYLYTRMNEGMKSSIDKSHGNWSILNEEFGPDVARAFRDGAISHWRRNKPKLLSEGAAKNITLFSTIFGLTGLAIETSEIQHWPETLNEAEAELAFRYAMYELNGFPSWLPRLFYKFPEVILRMSLQEISYELATEDEEKGSCYLLYDVSWSGDWLWDEIAPSFLETISISEPRNLGNLSYILNVIQGSSLSNKQISPLASHKSLSLRQPDHRAYWLAVWTGVDPDNAIPALEEYLNTLTSDEERTSVAMIYVAQLLGGRLSGSSRTREAFRSPTHLKSLYLLMHRYIIRSEDIERADMGVYSPGLRDDAQDARNRLFGLLKEIPGKESFLAIQEISSAHPDELSRPWFKLHARIKAESDADCVPWSPAQVREFYEEQERTPSCHRDLFDLAVMRLYDLKDDLENGDSSIASILSLIETEVDIRKYIGKWCRDCARERYSIPQEEELADAKRPDFRWHGVGFDAPVPMELKLADNWSGPKLFERLKTQLCSDYLRDIRSSRGIFILVYRGKQKTWELPLDRTQVTFDRLVQALQEYWAQISCDHPGVDEIRVIGIDLTKRNSATG